MRKDPTNGPIYVLPTQRDEVVVLGIYRAFDTLMQSMPVVNPDSNALASANCAMFEDGRIPTEDGRPLTNDMRRFREIFCESFRIGYFLGNPILNDGLYQMLMQLPAENRWGILYGIASGIVVEVPPDIRARLTSLSGLPAKRS